MMFDAAQLLISLLTVAGSVIGSFVGVKVSIAKLDTRMNAIEHELVRIDDRLKRLEQPHFEK